MNKVRCHRLWARLSTPLLPLLLLLLFAAPALAGSTVIHVDQSAGGANNGSNWANAYTDLQYALAAADVGAEIWVAAGVYKPISPKDANNVTPAERQATFQLINGLELYGGFAGTETARDQRDWLANPTVLSGDIDNNDLIDADGVVVDAADIVGSNSYHVVTGSNTNASAILDGFIITAGLADGGFVPPCGPDCGGGMYNESGSPTLRNVSFSGNRANDNGGGMINFNNSSPTLRNVSFSGNRAEEDGGGMANIDNSSPVLTDVSFSGNQASNGGGMHNVVDSSPTLTNVSFSGNQAHTGGGMYNVLDSSPTLTNASFSGNLANSGGGMYNGLSSPIVRNSLFWNNQDNSGVGTAGASVTNAFSSIPQISYSLVQGCNPDGSWNDDCGDDEGNNLANADPLFIDTPDPASAPTSAGNLRLQAGSPAIDAGNDDYVIGIATDLDGNPRIVGDGVDLGPYETQPADEVFADRFE